MKNLIIVTVSILFLTVFSYAQEHPGDSLKTGKICHFTLVNGYQTMVEITRVDADSVSFKTETKEFRIPRSQILCVNRPDYEIEQIVQEENKIFTSVDCNVYTDNGLKYSDMNLMSMGDSTLLMLRKSQTSPDIEKTIRINDIRKLEFEGPGFGRGMLIGSLIGFGMGLAFCLSMPDLIGYNNLPFEDMMGISLSCAIPSGLIGGLIGAIFRKDDIYLLPKGYSNPKAKRIKYLIEKHKQ